jgi:hypothetical protein
MVNIAAKQKLLNQGANKDTPSHKIGKAKNRCQPFASAAKRP